MYQRNEDGKVIDPPVIPDYERRVYAAMESDPGNTVKIERLTREYEQARNDLADQEDADERAAADAQEAKDAETRQAARDRGRLTTENLRNDPNAPDVIR